MVLSGLGLKGCFQLSPTMMRRVSFIESPRLVRKTNLNRATYSELVALPQIGPKDAEALLAYRKAMGRFFSIVELKDVPGLSVRAWEKGSLLLEIP